MKTQGGAEQPINLVGYSTFGRYSKISNEKTVNMFVSDGFLVDFFGYKKVGVWPESGAKGRGQFTSTRSNSVILVIGSEVISVDSSRIARSIGSLKSSIGLVTIDENLASQICICDGKDAYIYNTKTRSLTPQNMKENYGFVPNTVYFHDTYFLFGNGDFTANGSKYEVFRYGTDTTIEYVASPALQTRPDFALAAVPIPSGGNNILVFGKTVTEVQTDVGAASVNIYQRVSSFSIDYGTASVHSIASNDRMVAWLGINKFNAPALILYSGSNYQVISQKDKNGVDRTDGISYVIENVANPGASWGYMTLKDGHLFYVITFPDERDNFTLAYDFKNDGFIYVTDAHKNFFPPIGVSYFAGVSYFVSYINNGIYQISSNYTTYDENILTHDESKDFFIPRYRVCDNMRFPNGDQFMANLLRITLENGNDVAFNALTATQNIDVIVDEDGEPLITEDGELIITEDSLVEIPYIPKVDLSYSRDGGKTWSANLSMNYRFDAYRQSVVQWQNLGACNDFVPMFTFWTKSHVVVSSGVLEIKK